MPKGSKNNLIHSSVRIMGRIYTAEGATAREAIENLKPDIAKGLGILTLERGDVKKERILRNLQVMRLWGKMSAFNKEVGLKQVCSLFEGAF